MLRFMSIITLSAIAVPAVAAPPAPVMMTRDGVHYRYTSQLKGQLIAISGEQLDSGAAINLIVDTKGHVSGTMGDAPVAFNVPQASRDRIAATLASAPVADAQLATIR